MKLIIYVCMVNELVGVLGVIVLFDIALLS